MYNSLMNDQEWAIRWRRLYELRRALEWAMITSRGLGLRDLSNSIELDRNAMLKELGDCADECKIRGVGMAGP